MRLNALFSSGFVFACELYLWNSLSLLGGALRSVGIESLALSLALAVVVAQATDVQKRAGGLRSIVLWCTWLAAVALVAVAEAQATDVQKRAGGLRSGVLWCTWSAAVALAAVAVAQATDVQKRAGGQRLGIRSRCVSNSLLWKLTSMWGMIACGWCGRCPDQGTDRLG